MNITSKLLNINLCNYFARCSSSSTIFNLSSGYGKCGVAVIRVSGPNTKQALQSIVSKDFNPKERYAYLRSLFHPGSGEMIDKGLVLWFPSPKSFTGEDSCEFQVHGGIAVVAAMLDALSHVPGMRMSQPGEFTKRAFFSGKLDLTEVDGLADLIHAETEAQRKQALLQSTGSLSRLYQSWRKGLIECVAHMEAYIDFAEDENIEDDLIENLQKKLIILASEIQNHLSDQRQGEILREGVRTVIVGPPNVGKSSFLNLMCQRQVSIVTSIAGTTRDVIQTSYNVCGYPVLFADTAGLRKDTSDVVEKEGISRARDCIRDSDLILLLIDANYLVENSVTTRNSFEDFKIKYLEDLAIDPEALKEKKLVTILNKMDLVSVEDAKKLNDLDVAAISCTQNNLGKLLQKLENELKLICDQPSAENPRLTHFRYRQELVRCLQHINVFLNDMSGGGGADLAITAQKLRRAVKCIEVITGDVSTDDILDVVFKDFCIGK